MTGFRLPGHWAAALGLGVVALFSLASATQSGASVSASDLLVQDGTCREKGGTVFEPKKETGLPGGGERIVFRCGPIDVTPGQNRIEWPQIRPGVHRPDRDGWITRIQPDLVTEGGKSLRSDYVMFHHGVWLNQNRRDATATAWERVFGAGEEKTTLELPPGYGYRYLASDEWRLNHMLHNLINRSFSLYIQYTLDFYPDGSQGAGGMTQVRPIWMDVANDRPSYPVFNACRGQGGRDGKFTYPDDLPRSSDYEFQPEACSRSYPSSTNAPNRWTVDRDGYLVWTAGHVHAGGLWTDLNLVRQGARNEGPSCRVKANKVRGKKRAVSKQRRRIAKARKSGAPRSKVVRLRKRLLRLIASQTRKEADLNKCRDARPLVEGSKVRLFRSNAKYFKRNGREIGPISWDMGMFNTTDSWKPQLRKGDTLEISTTYETKRGSWYESMGINFSYMVDCSPGSRSCGENPYRVRQDNLKRLNHGPLPENRFHGGKADPAAPDPASLPAKRAQGSLLVGDWTYQSSDFRRGEVAAIRQGERLTFTMTQRDIDEEKWHSVTSCEAPCNRTTGISYPIPDGKFRFDSGQLGTGNRSPFPSAGTTGKVSWKTPDKMPPGLYTFFCRIHPDMRGAVKVLPRR